MEKAIQQEFRRLARKFPNTAKFIAENDMVNLRCNRCGSVVLKEPFVEGYPYQCMNCDENLYSIETHPGEAHTQDELFELFENTYSLLLLDDTLNESYFAKCFAAKLLLNDPVFLVLYESGSSQRRCPRTNHQARCVYVYARSNLQKP